MDRLRVCIQRKCHRPHLRRHSCGCSVGFWCSRQLRLLPLPTPHPFKKKEKKQKKKQDGFPDTGHSTAPKIVVSAKVRAQGKALCTATETNHTEQKDFRSEILKDNVQSPGHWQYSTGANTQHEIIEETGEGVQRKRASMGVFLLLCHTGAFSSESSPHQERLLLPLCKQVTFLFQSITQKPYTL